MQTANAMMVGKPFKATRKKLYTIHWRFGQIGERVYNRLEDVWYTVDENRCIILKGTAGEEWAVDCAKLMKTYNTGYDADHLGHLYTKHTVGRVVDKTWKAAKVKPDEGVYYAIKVPEKHQILIATSWGDALKVNRPGIGHDGGDYVICAALPDGSINYEDMWVVNGEIFKGTYDMRPFSRK